MVIAFCPNVHQFVSAPQYAHGACGVKPKKLCSKPILSLVMNKSHLFVFIYIFYDATNN